jgi:hypothetical protein
MQRVPPLRHGRDPLGWRWLTFFAAIPPLVSLFGTALVDESPAWLAARGRSEAGAVYKL